ncbi:MAG TPA: condensation domain-containing protein, partial [Rhodopila sp.]|nr:condensation domain-containing protein [Rhodopila sp.]
GMNRRTAALAERLNTAFRQHLVPFRVAWFASQFQVRHAVAGGETFQSLELAIFFFLLMERGIYTWERRVCFLSIAHTGADFDRIVAAAADSVREMRQAGFFGDPPSGGNRQDEPLVIRSEPAPANASGNTVELTPGQRDLAFRSAQGSAASTAFAEPLVLDLTGPLDLPALQQALDTVVTRHDALRMRRVNDRTAEIAPTLPVPILRQQLASLPPSLADDNAAGWLAAICREAFDLESGPLLRAHLLVLAPERVRFVLAAHHMVADGWSMGVVLQELARCYTALAEGHAPPALPQAVPLRDYNTWYTNRLTERRQQAASFWRARLADITPLALPTDIPRPPRSRGIGRRLRQTLDAAALTAFCRSHRCSSFMVLLAAWQALLARLSGQQQITIGIAGAGQAAMGAERLVGQCASILPLTTRISPGTSFAALLDGLKADLLAIWDHQDLRPEDLTDDLTIPPLRAAFNQDRDPGGWQFGRVEAQLAAAPIGFVKYDLFLNVIETGSLLILDLDYDEDLFAADTIEAWLNAYVALLRAALATPEAAVASLPLSAPAGPRVETAIAPSGVLARIAAHAAATPDRPALVRDGMVMTYGELGARLAHGRGIPVARQWIAAFARLDDDGVGGLSPATFARHVETWIEASEITAGDVVHVSDAAMQVVGLDTWAAPLAAGATVTAGQGGPTPTLAVLAAWEALTPAGTPRLLLADDTTLFERTAHRITRLHPDQTLFLLSQPAGLPVALGIQKLGTQRLDTQSDGWRRVALRQPSPALSARVLDPVGNPAIPGAIGTLHLGTQRTEATARLRADGTLEILPPGTADLDAALLAHPSVRRIAIERQGNAIRARVAVADVLVDAATLRRFLLRHLPAASLPSAFAVASGLPDLDTATWDTGVASSRADADASADIAALFRTVLRCADVGPHDDFFDLGGDSLAAVRLI